MSKRKRVTTSVSTLQAQITQLKLIAKLAGRKDLSKVFADISIRVDVLVADYTKLKLEIDPFVKLFNAAAEEEVEEEVTEEVEEEATEEVTE